MTDDYKTVEEVLIDELREESRGVCGTFTENRYGECDGCEEDYAHHLLQRALVVLEDHEKDRLDRLSRKDR